MINLSQQDSKEIKAQIKESYDAIADSYAAQFTDASEPLRLGYLANLFKRLGAKGDNDASVLELGCGAGVPATQFMLQNENPIIKVTGNDISTSQLDLARSALAKYTDRLDLIEGDMLSLAFTDGAFDAVSAFYSIIHLPREEQTQLMTKISRWVKPGGFFLANFSTEAVSAHEVQQWLGHEKGRMFWSSWGEEGSLKMVEEAGFEILEKEVHLDSDGGNFVWVLARRIE